MELIGNMCEIKYEVPQGSLLNIKIFYLFCILKKFVMLT